jgi:hypothetical protein
VAHGAKLRANKSGQHWPTKRPRENDGVWSCPREVIEAVANGAGCLFRNQLSRMHAAQQNPKPLVQEGVRKLLDAPKKLRAFRAHCGFFCETLFYTPHISY